MHGFHTKVKHACFVFVSAAVEFTDMRVYWNIVYCVRTSLFRTKHNQLE